MNIDISEPVYGIDYKLNIDYNSPENCTVISILSGEFSGVELLMNGVTITESEDKTCAFFKIMYDVLSGNDQYSKDDLINNQDLCNFIGCILNNCLTKKLGI